MNTRSRILGVLCACFISSTVCSFAQANTKLDASGMRNGDTVPVGVTGVTVQSNKLTKEVSVMEIQPGTPAFGKFEVGTRILGVNGTQFEGSDPWIVLGTALTKAEASDGMLNFAVKRKTDSAPVTVQIKIPVLGAYADSFPLNCGKTTGIVNRAAEFYSGKDSLKSNYHLSGVVCLFLLSTGDDKYVPRVKEYLTQFLKPDGTVAEIGEMSWDNGYNGVACAEYYLRTGDTSVLPILQYYCDDAKRRQLYGSGWNHWGKSANPQYEAGGGLMNPSGNQMLLTMVLGKMCGVDVDEKTLTGALRYFYRFVGHGIFPISDQRSWQSFGSVDRAGASSCVMQVAGFAKGDTSIYRQAKDYLTMFGLTSWPGNLWDVIWYDISAPFRLDADPKAYHQTQQSYRWAYDLYRQPAGNFYYPPGHSALDPSDAGAAVALALTSPRKKLCISGAPLSKYAKPFTLPEQLWGNQADLAFLSPLHHKDFTKYGDVMDSVLAYTRLPLTLKRVDVRKLEPDFMLQYVRHARCEIRSAAAKALSRNKRWGDLEALLRDPDPRLRRAALDGINDYNPWFFAPPVATQALPAAEFTPAMCDAITAILNNPAEAWYVIDGAMMALSHAPVELIEKNIPRILPWTKHGDWWMRDSAFQALIGLKPDKELFLKHLPTLIDMLTRELHANPHARMIQQLQLAAKQYEPDSEVGRLIVAGWIRAGLENSDPKDPQGIDHSIAAMVNSIEVFQAVMESSPESAADLAEAIAKSSCLSTFDDKNLVKILKDKDGQVSDRYVGIYPMLENLPTADRQRLAATLFDHFRPELIKRINATKGTADLAMLDMLVELTRLRSKCHGWQAVGAPLPTERVWKFMSFDEKPESAKTSRKNAATLRVIQAPQGLENWYAPEFDDSGWKSGRTPIGVGVFMAHGHGRAWTATPKFSFKNASDWGAGEFLYARSKFEVTDEDCDFYRLSVLSDRGYHIYLNGKRIHTFAWFAHFPQYTKVMLSSDQARLIRKGTNTLAVYTTARYEKDPKSEGKEEQIGQIDLLLEGLKKQELGLSR